MQRHLMAETAEIASAGEIHLDDLQTGLAEIEKLLHVTGVAAKSRDGAAVTSDIGTVIFMVCETLGRIQKDLEGATVADYQISDLYEAYEDARGLREQECRDEIDGDTAASREFNAAEASFLSYQPVTLDGAHAKAEKILSDRALFQSLLNENELRLFIASLTYRAGRTLQ